MVFVNSHWSKVNSSGNLDDSHYGKEKNISDTIIPIGIPPFQMELWNPRWNLIVPLGGLIFQVELFCHFTPVDFVRVTSMMVTA